MAQKKARKQHSPATSSPAHEELEKLTGVELDARRRERLKTVEVLKTGRTPLNLIEVANDAATLATEEIEEFKKSSPAPRLACKEGCDWCCYLTVGTCVPEVVNILQYLRQHLSHDEFGRFQERVVAFDNQKRAMRPGEREAAHLPCPLLVNHRCTAYPVRPLTCRGFNSSDARKCELFLEEGNRIRVPVYTPQLRLNTFVLDGLRAGLTESRLKGDLLELTAALRIALEVPDAIERWLAGESVFGPARM